MSQIRAVSKELYSMVHRFFFSCAYQTTTNHASFFYPGPLVSLSNVGYLILMDLRLLDMFIILRLYHMTCLYAWNIERLHFGQFGTVENWNYNFDQHFCSDRSVGGLCDEIICCFQFVAFFSSILLLSWHLWPGWNWTLTIKSDFDWYL